MSVEYGIYNISSNRYVGRVLPSGQITEAEYLAELGKAFPELRQGTLAAIFARGLEIINTGLADNKVVHTPMASYQPVVKGSFANKDAHFSADHNRKDVSALRTREMQKAIQDVPYNKVAVRTVQPHPVDFYNANTQSHNGTLSPGGMAELNGDQLAFAQDRSSEGIFFRSLKDDSEVQVQEYLKITEHRISFSIPANLAMGGYVLVLRRSYTVRNELRSGELNVVLTVV